MQTSGFRLPDDSAGLNAPSIGVGWVMVEVWGLFLTYEVLLLHSNRYVRVVCMYSHGVSAVTQQQLVGWELNLFIAWDRYRYLYI